MLRKACYNANKHLVGKTFLILFTFTIALINIYSIVNPGTLIPVRFRPQNIGIFSNEILVPTKMFTIMDIFVLGLLILVIIYSIGIDLDNKMDDLTLTMCESNYNKYLLGKIMMILKIYIPLYIITYINMYYLIAHNALYDVKLLGLIKCIYISFTTQFFVISLTIFFMFLIRNVRAVLLSLGAYFVFIEFIIGHNFLQSMGVYSHFFIYNENIINDILSNRFLYNIFSIILLYVGIRLSGKERKKVGILS